ncbi:MAG: D-Ala-D-Ala carboxypeptidase family metallohydrolase [Candidatus Methylomirabilota bacterium]|jgi:uncharacterized protein YcbK (DUF882 family)
MGDLSEHFSKSEFACKCGCGADAVDPELITRLEQLRAALGSPIVILSGCRCPAWNAKQGEAKPDSAHLTDPAQSEICQAADVQTPTGHDRFAVLAAAVSAGGFRRVGIGRTFIHMDIDHWKPQDDVWLYS